MSTKLAAVLGATLCLQAGSALATPTLRAGALELLGLDGYTQDSISIGSLPSGITLSATSASAQIELQKNAFGTWYEKKVPTITITNNSNTTYNGSIVGHYHSTGYGGTSPYIYLDPNEGEYGYYYSYVQIDYPAFAEYYANDSHFCETTGATDCTDGLGGDYNEGQAFFSIPGPGQSATIYVTAEVQAALIPEPGSFPLMATGILGIGAIIAARGGKARSTS